MSRDTKRGEKNLSSFFHKKERGQTNDHGKRYQVLYKFSRILSATHEKRKPLLREINLPCSVAKEESCWFSSCVNDENDDVDERNISSEWQPLHREKRFPRIEGIENNRMLECSSQTVKKFFSHDRTGNRHEIWWLESTSTTRMLPPST